MHVEARELHLDLSCGRCAMVRAAPVAAAADGAENGAGEEDEARDEPAKPPPAPRGGQDKSDAAQGEQRLRAAFGSASSLVS